MKVKELYMVAEELLEQIESGEIDGDDAVMHLSLEFNISIEDAQSFMDNVFANA